MNLSRTGIVVLVATIFLAGWFASRLGQPAAAQAALETRPSFGTFAIAPAGDSSPTYLVASPDGHLWLVNTVNGRIIVVDEHSLAAHK